ncbi:hypothetical protein [Candidatus Endomicrobiellum agilis]|uniref:hypothetical protein n=1 Tax=Candidatus Endomicrobiellum agilis TaxID=3238957 RepID=UPI0035851A74|nr:hypothetical protein [Endomicrobium sp.]
MAENVESVTEDILKETRNIYISAQSLIRRLCGKFDEPPRDLIETTILATKPNNQRRI